MYLNAVLDRYLLWVCEATYQCLVVEAVSDGDVETAIYGTGLRISAEMERDSSTRR